MGKGVDGVALGAWGVAAGAPSGDASGVALDESVHAERLSSARYPEGSGPCRVRCACGTTATGGAAPAVVPLLGRLGAARSRRYFALLLCAVGGPDNAAEDVWGSALSGGVSGSCTMPDRAPGGNAMGTPVTTSASCKLSCRAGHAPVKCCALSSAHQPARSRACGVGLACAPTLGLRMGRLGTCGRVLREVRAPAWGRARRALGAWAAAPGQQKGGGPYGEKSTGALASWLDVCAASRGVCIVDGVATGAPADAGAVLSLSPAVAARAGAPVPSCAVASGVSEAGVGGAVWRRSRCARSPPVMHAGVQVM
jgi:hypothetical protein